MVKTYLQVQKQIAELQKEADQLRKKEADGVLSRIKEAIAVYGFTAAELGVGRAAVRNAVTEKPAEKVSRRAKKPQAPVSAPQFKDENGNVWSGRGPRPAWFKAALAAGRNPADLRI